MRLKRFLSFLFVFSIVFCFFVPFTVSAENEGLLVPESSSSESSSSESSSSESGNEYIDKCIFRLRQDGKLNDYFAIAREYNYRGYSYKGEPLTHSNRIMVCTSEVPFCVGSNGFLYKDENGIEVPVNDFTNPTSGVGWYFCSTSNWYYRCDDLSDTNFWTSGLSFYYYYIDSDTYELISPYNDFFDQFFIIDILEDHPQHYGQTSVKTDNIYCNFDFYFTSETAGGNSKIHLGKNSSFKADSSLMNNSTVCMTDGELPVLLKPIQSYFDFSYFCNSVTLTDTAENKLNLYFYSKTTPSFIFNSDDTVTVNISDGYMMVDKVLEDNGLLYSDDDIPKLDPILGTPVPNDPKYKHNLKYSNGCWYKLSNYTYTIDKSNIDTFRWCSPVKQSEVKIYNQILDFSRDNSNKVNDKITAFGQDPLFIDYMDNATLDDESTDNYHICTSEEVEILTHPPYDVDYSFTALQYNDNIFECGFYYYVDGLSDYISKNYTSIYDAAYAKTSAGVAQYFCSDFDGGYKQNNDGSSIFKLHMWRDVKGYIKVNNYDLSGKLKPYYILLRTGNDDNAYYMTLYHNYDFFGGKKTIKTNWNACINGTSPSYDLNNKDFYLNQDGTSNGYNKYAGQTYDDNRLTNDLRADGIIGSDDSASMKDNYNQATGTKNPISGGLSADFDFSDINSFFNSLGNFWTWLSAMFSFMPAWFWTLFAISSTLIIFLRILGR